jgi:hypothetical protein
VYRVNSVHIYSILLRICEMRAVRSIQFTTKYLCEIFMGDGVKHVKEFRRRGKRKLAA